MMLNKFHSNRLLLKSLVGLVGIFASSLLLVQAQTGSSGNTPLTKPIRLVVPYAAGGPIDVTARALAERVKDTLGTVIIDNKPGAGGALAITAYQPAVSTSVASVPPCSIGGST